MSDTDDKPDDRDDALLTEIYRSAGDAEPDAALDRRTLAGAAASSQRRASPRRLPWAAGGLAASRGGEKRAAVGTDRIGEDAGGVPRRG